MENSKLKNRTRILFVLYIIQIIMSIGVGIWAITQKVEAEKQKILALESKEEAQKANKQLEELLKNCK